ncbi:hypothetical protein PHYSODRAFT_525236 [Phytophthora sojae]|uniref:Heat shock protein 70 n=1 Tax=Phytophthora sojae (strain P6497) TaxID=1094619 RepID=G5A5C8_PHYSP|nr:hypothetical protein PHYSODRAFT_525236 [Phytophthora sojae]EGZ09312.1 hypothetical protein PHYSODRAFT_525236 [Phytophthora sojae]|eukprot:XP_009535945.1 hypothetical protein PHYSODRAFT_525236 [Phytophthora sojae]
MANKTTGGPSIGIDIGTAYSRVAIWHKDRAEILPNRFGNRLTSSYVAFTDSKVLVGDAAADQRLQNAENTVFGITRLLGRKFSDPEVQERIKHWPFKVIRGPHDTPPPPPHVMVQFRGQTKIFHPVQILSLLLSEMRGIVETYTGKEATTAVVTVPAHFNYSQRQAVKDAGAIAEIQVMRMISRSTAASISYGINKKGSERRVLVVDLGASTLDVSVVEIEDGNFEVCVVLRGMSTWVAMTLTVAW